MFGQLDNYWGGGICSSWPRYHSRQHRYCSRVIYIYIYIKREYRYTRSGISTSIVVIFHLGTGAWRDIVISEGGGEEGKKGRSKKLQISRKYKLRGGKEGEEKENEGRGTRCARCCVHLHQYSDRIRTRHRDHGLRNFNGDRESRDSFTYHEWGQHPTRDGDRFQRSYRPFPRIQLRNQKTDYPLST